MDKQKVIDDLCVGFIFSLAIAYGAVLGYIVRGAIEDEKRFKEIHGEKGYTEVKIDR